jgi:transposase
MGRPTLLTPDLGAAIVELVREGVPTPSAAEAVGISKATVRECLRRGEERDGRAVKAADATPADA